MQEQSGRAGRAGHAGHVVDDDFIQQLSKRSFLEMVPEHCAYLRTLKAEGFEPRVIYDVGACVLHWTNYARTLWPDAHYIVFDAFDRAEFLYKQAGLDYHMGVLSDVDGRVVDFYQNDHAPGGNSYYREIGCGPVSDKIFPIGSSRKEIASTIDTVATLRGFPAPDLIKIDVQGAEQDIMLGAKRTFATAKHLIIEMQHTEYNEGAPQVQETTPIITGLGWRTVGMIQRARYDADYAFVR